METRANHVWVGAVTLALLAALFAFVVWIARLNNSDQNQYDIFFKQSVDGLAKGSQVAFAGVPAGQIAKIELWKRDPSFVKVRIKVDNEVPILQGTTATIQGSFTGVSTIQLEGAVKGAKPITCETSACPEGVPVIPTRQGGLGAILSNAPLLLERLATLTERLTATLNDQNQKSIQGILANTDRITAGMADASPQIQRTMLELQITLRQAQGTLADFQKLSGSASRMLDENGQQLSRQLSQTLKSAQGAADALNATVTETRPAARQLSESTLPAAEAAIRDLRATTRALRDVTEKLNEQGVGGLVGGSKLPDYKP
jgi:phospholipid/cholesterol/gamma-HCH transport system substrate-binding protein